MAFDSRNRRPSRRATGGALLATALTASLLSPVAASADPCSGQVGDLNCGLGNGGSSGGGGVVPGENSGGLGGQIPELPGLGLGGGGTNTGTPPQPTRATIDIANQVRSSAHLPTPLVHTAPDGKTYVQVKTALWVDGFDIVKTPEIKSGDQRVQATATPKSVTWNMGDTSLTCAGPGAKNSTVCSHTYRRSSAGQPGKVFRITATIVWGVTWTCVGGECDAPSGTLDDLTMPSVPTPLAVGEIQTGNRP